MPVWASYSSTVQTGPGIHIVPYTGGIGSFQGIKRPELGVDHPSSSNAEVKERVDLYF
jgi:hypothetical protein